MNVKHTKVGIRVLRDGNWKSLKQFELGKTLQDIDGLF